MLGVLVMSIFDIFKKRNNQINSATTSLSKKDNSEIKSELLRLVRNGIVMQEDYEKTTSPDACKIGGKPFLPVDFIWPAFTSKDDNETRPLSFFCQLNLSELSSFDEDKQLPSKGMLSFFYECESFRWGFDPEDKGAVRVFYFEDLTNFIAFDVPGTLNEEYIIPEIAVKFKKTKTYPNVEELEKFSNVECDWDDYEKVLGELGVNIDEDLYNHMVLGYADVIQGEMLSECERVSRGLYCGDPESYQNTPAEVTADINDKARDWTLLLQLSTITKNDFEWMFGDCGMLYYYIKKEDLAEKRFDNVWFSLQCG